MSSPPTLVIPGLASLTGSMLLGHLFNWGLMGVLGIQVYIYTLSFPKDSKYMKALVGGVFVIDILQTAFATHYAWYVLAAGWGNPSAIRFTPLSLATIPPLSGTVAFLVQIFFVWRIWKLAVTEKALYFTLMGFITVTAVGSLIAAWWAGILSGAIRDVAQASRLNKPVTCWLAGSVACDVMITATLVFQLLRRRSRDVISRKTNRIIHRAVRKTIETGALTAVVVIIELILYLNAELTGWYFMLGMLIGKLYSNSLLANLNSRAPIFQIGSTDSNSTPAVGPWNSNQRSTLRDAENSVDFRRGKGGRLSPSTFDTTVDGSGVHMSVTKVFDTERGGY